MLNCKIDAVNSYKPAFMVVRVIKQYLINRNQYKKNVSLCVVIGHHQILLLDWCKFIKPLLVCKSYLPLFSLQRFKWNMRYQMHRWCVRTCVNRQTANLVNYFSFRNVPLIIFIYSNLKHFVIDWCSKNVPTCYSLFVLHVLLFSLQIFCLWIALFGL